MFKMKYKGIIVVQDNDVCWIGCHRRDAGQILLRMPLEQVLNDESVVDQIPKYMKGNNKTLCIVPDHWFDSESYPFRSKKPSLIEPFLERKLASAYPEKKAIQHLFNYRSIPAVGDEHGLYTYFLQDHNAFRLYSALKKMHLAPRQITAPGFLWEYKLKQNDSAFDQEGTLLIHMNDRECQLYFYFKGHYLFSRSVILTEAPDAMDALTFEINQSLYMFSQKSKSDLARIYLLTGNPETLDVIAQELGREVVDITPQINKTRFLELPEVPFLYGLLNQINLVSPPRFFSVTHRRVKQELEWKPVQWAGILVGGLLLLVLMGESLFLNKLIHNETVENQKIRQQLDNPSGTGLSGYESILDRVLYQAEQPTCANTIMRLLSSLPNEVWVKELNVRVDEAPELKLAAVVHARDADHFKKSLTLLVAKIKQNFHNTEAFSINDIEIRMDPFGNDQTTFHYRVSLRLNLL